MTAIALTLTNLAEYREYFEKIANEATFIDFFAYTKEDWSKSSSNANRTGWNFILEPYTAGIKDNTADSVLSYNEGMFVIAKKKTNELKHWEIEEEAQVLAHKVIGRMRRDRSQHLIKSNFDNFTLDTINPMAASGYHGVAVRFQFYHSIIQDMKFIADDWQIPTP